MEHAPNDIDEIVLPNDLPLEDICRTTSEKRQNMWKQQLCLPIDLSPSMQPPHLNSTVSSLDEATHLPILNNVRLPLPAKPVAIEDTVTKWTLNVEQARAFSLIAAHSQNTHGVEPLQLYLGGPGGTGKSRVITALTDHFNICGEARRLRLASFTG